MRVFVALAFVIFAAIVGDAGTASGQSKLVKPPSLSAYFLGTWSCRSALNSVVVKAYGLNPDGTQLILWNSYVTTSRELAASRQTYTDDGSALTVVDPFGGRVFTGTSTGWNVDTLTFVGPVVITPATSVPAPSVGPISQRMTYTRTDNDHFTRSFETAPIATGPWAAVSHESCTRIAAPLSAPTGYPTP
jgi:hypothetical protein